MRKKCAKERLLCIMYHSPFSIQLIFIKVEGYVSKQLFISPLHHKGDLDGQKPFWGDLILKWSNSSQCSRNFCQDSGTCQETLDKQGAVYFSVVTGVILILLKSHHFGLILCFRRLNSDCNVLRLSHSLPVNHTGIRLAWRLQG